jgi:hypothetical protein
MSYVAKYLEIEKYIYALEKLTGLKVTVTYEKRHDKKYYDLYIGGQLIGRNMEFRCLFSVLKAAALVAEAATRQQGAQGPRAVTAEPQTS